MTICMLNGGMYKNIEKFDGLYTHSLTYKQIEDILRKKEFVEIETPWTDARKAIVRTTYISSINFKE